MSLPNILLIMTDQQRWDTLGCYGNSVIETPNLDWLASVGTVFENAYTPSPSCVPARASLLTGMKPWNTGVLGTGRGQGPMGEKYTHTLPEELAKAGYHTQGIGKMNFNPQRALNGFHNTILDESEKGLESGFISDYKKWFDNNKTGDYGIVDHGINWNSWMSRPYHAPEFLHPTNWTVNESISFLEKRDPNKPFFLKASFTRPHSPYDPPQYYFDLYANQKEIPKAEVGKWAEIHNVKEDSLDPDAWRGVRSDEEIKRARAGYYGSIHHIDHQIGRLFSKLKKEGIFEETLIVFTSDHGDMLGDHNLWRKTYAYEGSSHIPLIIKLPRSEGKVHDRVEHPALLQDIMPTILDSIHSNIPEHVDGESLLPLMKGKPAKWRQYIHGEHSTCYSEEQEMQFLTDGKMKYIWFPRLAKEQLFDLSKDRYEKEDLVSKGTDEANLLKWRKRMVEELRVRDSGLTDGDHLISQADKPYLVSPHYKKWK